MATQTGSKGWIGHATWTCSGRKLGYGRTWAKARTFNGVDYLALAPGVMLEAQHLLDGRERLALLVDNVETETLLCSKADARRIWSESRKIGVS